MWGPLATTATLDLPPRRAGAASGIYNTTRTIGSVLGSAGIAALMQARLEANLGGAASGSAGGLGTGQLPAAIVEPFSSAMGQSMLLSVAAMAVGLVMALFLRRSRRRRPCRDVRQSPSGPGSEQEWRTQRSRLCDT